MRVDEPQGVLFHVGYHKTATTWMQREFFRERVGFRQVLSPDQVAEFITDPVAFYYNAAAVRCLLEARMDRSGLANVVSNETLCGHPFYGGREGPIFAERIKAAAPDAKILFTLREQKKALVSTYLQYITRGGSLSPDAFFGGGDEKYGYYRFNVRHFLYDRLVAQYLELFGRHRVLVVTLESFVRDPGAVLGSIARFAGADPAGVARALPARPVAESPAEAVAPVLRRINHFRPGAAKQEVVVDLGGLWDGLYRVASRLGRTPGVKARLRQVTPVSSVVRARFGGCFGESNRRLQTLLGRMLDLAGDGFELDGAARLARRPSAVVPDAPAGHGRVQEARLGDQGVQGALPPA